MVCYRCMHTVDYIGWVWQELQYVERYVGQLGCSGGVLDCQGRVGYGGMLAGVRGILHNQGEQPCFPPIRVRVRSGLGRKVAVTNAVGMIG